MTAPAPNLREAGTGPLVLCLHANASSSSQWRALMDRLAPRFHVIAADSYGAGKSPPWPVDRVPSLAEEVALLDPVFASAAAARSDAAAPGAASGVVLVAHSYGAAVALKAASVHAGQVRALALYEPTLFGLLDAACPSSNVADGIRQAVAEAESALARGDAAAAAGIFIDYWMGPGAWAVTPVDRRGPIVASIVNVGRWAHALFGEPATLRDWARIDVPVLLMTGRDSPASALGVAALLAQALPQAQTLSFDGLGHMGPVTQPDVVNDAIARFLDDCSTAATAAPRSPSATETPRTTPGPTP